MPSCTGVVQAGSRRFTPDTSTMHRRQAPTGVRLSSQHSVGIYLPLARATSRIVWPSCAATYSPSIRIESLSGKRFLLQSSDRTKIRTKATRFGIYRRDGTARTAGAPTPSFEGDPSLGPRLAQRSNQGRGETGWARGGLFRKPGRGAEGAESAEFQIWFLSASGRPLPLRARLGGEQFLSVCGRRPH